MTNINLSNTLSTIKHISNSAIENIGKFGSKTVKAIAEHATSIKDSIKAGTARRDLSSYVETKVRDVKIALKGQNKIGRLLEDLPMYQKINLDLNGNYKGIKNS